MVREGHLDCIESVPTGQQLGALLRRWVCLRRLTVTSQEGSHRTRFMIDNNSDNNPRRHRRTQDDTPAGKSQ
jgi:hypothetical protein